MGYIMYIPEEADHVPFRFRLLNPLDSSISPLLSPLALLALLPLFSRHVSQPHEDTSEVL